MRVFWALPIFSHKMSWWNAKPPAWPTTGLGKEVDQNTMSTHIPSHAVGAKQLRPAKIHSLTPNIPSYADVSIQMHNVHVCGCERAGVRGRLGVWCKHVMWKCRRGGHDNVGKAKSASLRACLRACANACMRTVCVGNRVGGVRARMHACTCITFVFAFACAFACAFSFPFPFPLHSMNACMLCVCVWGGEA